MQVFPAYNNYHKQSKWLSLYIELKNISGNFDGKLVVESQSANNNLIYSTQISIFGNTKKAKYLYVYPEASQSLISVKLKDKQDKSIIEKNMRFDVISSDARLVTFIKQVEDTQRPFISNDDGQLYFSTISAEKLPDEWKGYDPVNAIFLGNISLNSISDKKEKALVNWLYNGGTLIVSGGINAQRFDDTFVEKLLPVEISGTQIVDSIKSLNIYKSKMVVSSSRLKDDSKPILVENDGMLIIAEKKVGLGKCIFLCFDYNDPAIEAFLNSKNFWDMIFAQPEKSIDVKYNNISRLIANQRNLSLPSYKIIGGFGLLYVLSIAISGFINKRSRKKELIWLFVFIIIIVFILSSFGFSYTMNKKSLIISDFSVVNVHRDTKSAKITSYFSPLSFTKSNLEISFPNAIFIERPVSKDGASFWKENFEIDQNDNFQLNISGMAFSPSNFLYGETIVDFGGNIYEDIINTDRLKISNKTGFAFRDCLLIMNNKFAQIKNLESDSEIDIELMNSSSDDVFDNYSLDDDNRKQFFNAIKSSLYGEISDKSLICWFDGSALEFFAGMSLNRSYRSLGKALIIMNL
jgi:hypothetical protein